MATINKYLLGALIVAILIIATIAYLKGCGNKPAPTAPAVVNPVIITDKVINQENAAQPKTNSINKAFDSLNSIIKAQKVDLANLDQQKRTLEAALKFSIDCPGVSDYEDISNKRDTVCDGIVANQKTQLSLKDTLLQQKQTLYDSLRNRFNFLANQSTAQKLYTDSLQPKNQYYIGGGLYGNKLSFVQGADIGIFLKTKTDRVYKFDVMYDFNYGVQYGLSTYFKIHL